MTRRRITAKEIPLVKAALLKSQEYQCPLCAEPLTIVLACTDHDHKSGLIRGALCRNCNGIEGKVFNLANRAKRGKRPMDWLGSLILYWIKHETSPSNLYHPLHRTTDEKRLRTNARARKRRASKPQEQQVQ